MKFRKKPIVIEAIHFDGDNYSEIVTWVDSFVKSIHRPVSGSYRGIHIETLEGEMLAAAGDWIIRGVKGEFYPCKPDIFEETYEPVKADVMTPDDWTRVRASPSQAYIARLLEEREMLREALQANQLTNKELFEMPHDQLKEFICRCGNRIDTALAYVPKGVEEKE